MRTMIITAHGWLERFGEYAAPLGLRVLLAWEYGEAGIRKLRGENWFRHIQDDFPFPFSAIPPEVNWAIATWAEILGALALLVGLATRFFSATLIILTVVAIGAVHWPDSWGTLGGLLQGYAITDRGHGNYKLPVIFIAMLLPLLLLGPGKASVDHWLRTRVRP